MISTIGMVCSFKWSCGTDSCKFKTSDKYTHCALLRRLSKLEMLKRRGKGPPKKGQGKQAAKRKKNWCLLVFLELDYLLNKEAVSLWNSFEESSHLLLSYCPLALDVVEIATKLSGYFHIYMCVVACHASFTFCLKSRSVTSVKKKKSVANTLFVLLLKETQRNNCNFITPVIFLVSKGTIANECYSNNVKLRQHHVQANSGL